MAANPFHPQWFRDALYLDRLHHGDYQGASAALKPRARSDFWHSAMETAVRGKLDRGQEAAKHARILLESRPDFCTRGRELMGRSIKVASLVEEIVDGLRRAGLAIAGH